MPILEYARPATMSEALGLASEYGQAGKLYAGGTDLMVQLRERAGRLAQTTCLIDLGGVGELAGIAEENGAVHVGAMTTHAALAASPVLREHAPFLAASASTVGAAQIRNKGTVGGNVANGSPAADTLSALVALDARACIESLRGARQVLLKDLYQGAGEIDLALDEVITRFEFASLRGWGTAFHKLGRRKALAISRMNMAAALLVEDGVIVQARLSPGSVFAVPDRVAQAEALLAGQRPGADLFVRAGLAVAEEMVARTGVRWSTEYKRPVAQALARRALEDAYARSGGGTV